MSNELLPFTYEGATVRTVILDNEPWFVLADLCTVLDIAAPGRLAARLDQGVRQTHTLQTAGGPQRFTVVSEPGMYEVVIRSDKPEAVKFRRWITGEVLPTIRKTGSYGQPARLTPLEYARQLVAAEERAETEQAARIEAEAHARALHAPASAWSHLADSSGDYSVADAAKVLSRDPAIVIGRDRLFRFMQGERWIFRDATTDAWKARQTQVDTGRLTEKLGSPYLHEPSGEMRNPAPTIRITAKGLAELHKRLGGSDALPTMATAQ